MKRRKKEETADELFTKLGRRFLAREIVNELFTNGSGKVANRLVLFQERNMGSLERNLGGWGFKPAVDVVEDVINRIVKSEVI